MSDVLSDETRLVADFERLKVEFPKTRELYRELCALLFFRFGVPLAANRLYRLVRGGTMSTPAWGLERVLVGVAREEPGTIGSDDPSFGLGNAARRLRRAAT
ncbi:hypothetical protein [Caballeronia sp. LZ029]|uniref:hypothetical protein n=1 Tax=Caballeronia sp. LZ029 TaxID=3038564 RepID=UPI00286CD454|nr:hypothetical protein [Caballeronia sp. LZ029]